MLISSPRYTGDLQVAYRNTIEPTQQVYQDGFALLDHRSVPFVGAFDAEQRIEGNQS